MAASENLTLIRMLIVLALFVPVMLFGLYHTDVKKHGAFLIACRLQHFFPDTNDERELRLTHGFFFSP